MSTVTVPEPVPTEADDSEQLRKALAGWGTKEKLITSILIHRNAAQRMLIRQTYADTYGEDLLKILDGELTNDFERLVVLWMLDTAERDAYLANEATKRWISSDQVLVEIACTRSPQQLLVARQAYHARYKESLEEDVAHFRKLLVPLYEVPLVSSYCYDGDEVNRNLSKAEAEILRNKISKNAYSHEDSKAEAEILHNKISENAYSHKDSKAEAEILHNKISENAYSHKDLIRIFTRSKTHAVLNHYGNEFGNDLNKGDLERWGTNEKLIISILAHRNAAQRKLIRQTYAETYGEDLLEALDRELMNDFERLVFLLTLDPAERDAYLANEATKRGISGNQVLMEIACTRSPQQLLMTRQAYHARYKKSLEEDVAHHTTGDFRKVLLLLIGSYRYSGLEVDRSLAEADAAILHEKISEKDYSHQKVRMILATRSKAQVKATLDHYRNAYGHDINKDLKADPNDQFLHLLRTIVKCLTHPEKYFEKVLHVAINAENRDEGAIARVLSTRAKVNLDLYN